jgi:nucleoside-diphosphate-sugar epimerase
VYEDVAGPLATLRAALAAVPNLKLGTIYHLASPASPEAYGSMPWQTIAANVIGTMSLVELALEYRSTLLFSSTSEVYGDPLVDPQPETYFGNVNPVGPRACYDEGKRCGEAVMSVAANSRGLDARIVRIFNCYGPRMDSGDGRLVPSLLAAARGGLPLPIHGDGSQRRSMTYVDDLIDGLLCVANARQIGFGPVNLGADDERTVLEIAAAAAAAAGIEPVYEFGPPRPEDPQRRRPDASRARSLGWSPRVELADGLRRTYAWMADDALEYA